MLTKTQIDNNLRWRDDLRTTNAKQGTGRLGDSIVGYCCLGRACIVADISYGSIAGNPNHYNWQQCYGFANKNDLISLSQFINANDIELCTFQQIADLIDIMLMDDFSIDPTTGDSLDLDIIFNQLPT